MDAVYNSRSIQEEGHRFEGKPAWLDLFLEKTFFDFCAVHDHCKNYRNRYCINCNLALCQYCIASETHYGHDILKLYRHVYKDVVQVDDIGKYVDCSQIQPFKCNKLWVFSLKPLPHKESGSQAEAEHACETCRRILSDPSLHRYCCLDCKVKALSVKERSGEGEEGRRSKRKGNPQRAPLF